jgi:CBS domain containing-hemolysin-like protein
MEAEHLFRWVALGALVLLCGIFAAAETSLFALSPLERLRLKERKHTRGELVEALLTRPRRLLITVLMGVETVNILATVLATSVAISFWGPRGKWLALGVFAPLFLLVGEIIPKSLALAYPSRLARWLAPLVRPAIFLFTPFRVVLLQLSRGILATLGFRTDMPVPAVHQEDFVRMVEESHRGGMIAALERDFIQNLLSFGELRVGQIMVPRPDIFSLPLDLPTEQLVQAIKRSRFSRVPIYQDTPDNILGVLHAKDLLYIFPGKPGEAKIIENLLRAPLYVPESKQAFDLLTELQTQHLRLALVVDEYGTLVGLVTVEDLLEELCGEIPQEFQVEEKVWEEVAPGVFRVKAYMSLADFNETVGADFPTEEFDTIGGLVLNLFGELPREGDVISHEDLTFRVVRKKGTRILELEVRRG